MDRKENENDELLVRYLDRELSAFEIEEFERTLASDLGLRQKLEDWRALGERLGELRSLPPEQRRLDASFSERVIEAARQRVREQADPSLAPWIARETTVSTVEVASRLQNRDVEPVSAADRQSRERSRQRWIIGGSLMAVAAGLLAIVVFNLPSTKPNALLSPQAEIAQDTSPLDHESSNSNTSQIVLNDRKDSDNDSDRSDSVPPINSPTDRTPPGSIDENLKSKASEPSANSIAAASPAPSKNNGAVSLKEGPDIKPSAEQLQMLEEMMANPNGIFLMVIDVELPEGITDLDGLRSVLNRHDIAWASELNIDESVQSNLAKSRMIAEAGKRGLIPDYVASEQDRSKSQTEGDEKEVVSLVFVKARGSRLDAAILEVMQQTDEFPVFSFDLAFDPPTQTLMNELRFVQEASLPASKSPAHENVSNVIRRTQDAPFFASPRRSRAMELETRRQGRLPLDAETMNPISYALFIVRHAAPNSNR